ncbi:MAG: RDD family protein [Burkholderiales bacterium]|nr:RDD family protein [Burkholderiales bacterium]
MLLFGVVFIAAYLYSSLTRFRADPASPLYFGFQATVFAAVGLYFVLCWRRAGQTLPMKTWKFRLVAADGTRPSLARCWLRYTLAWIGPVAGLAAYKGIVLAAGFGMARFSAAAALLCLPVLALNFAWALVDRDRQFLHDRMAGTRLVVR